MPRTAPIIPIQAAPLRAAPRTQRGGRRDYLLGCEPPAALRTGDVVTSNTGLECRLTQIAPERYVMSVPAFRVAGFIVPAGTGSEWTLRQLQDALNTGRIAGLTTYSPANERKT